MDIGVAGGVQWVHLHPPRAVKKIFSGLIYRKNV